MTLLLKKKNEFNNKTNDDSLKLGKYFIHFYIPSIITLSETFQFVTISHTYDTKFLITDSICHIINSIDEFVNMVENSLGFNRCFPCYYNHRYTFNLIIMLSTRIKKK